jgi:hypothetical protein
MFDGTVSYESLGEECPRDPTGEMAPPFQPEVIG